MYKTYPFYVFGLNVDLKNLIRLSLMLFLLIALSPKEVEARFCFRKQQQNLCEIRPRCIDWSKVRVNTSETTLGQDLSGKYAQSVLIIPTADDPGEINLGSQLLKKLGREVPFKLIFHADLDTDLQSSIVTAARAFGDEPSHGSGSEALKRACGTLNNSDTGCNIDLLIELSITYDIQKDPTVSGAGDHIRIITEVMLTLWQIKNKPFYVVDNYCDRYVGYYIQGSSSNPKQTAAIQSTNQIIDYLIDRLPVTGRVLDGGEEPLANIGNQLGVKPEECYIAYSVQDFTDTDGQSYQRQRVLGLMESQNIAPYASTFRVHSTKNAERAIKAGDFLQLIPTVKEKRTSTCGAPLP